MAVKIENLDYIYNKHTNMAMNAIKNISMEISESESVALLGPSGSGKSTLLSLIAGIENAESGTVKVDTGISMMFQSPENQLFAQSIIEDVMYGPMNMGLHRDDARRAAIIALKTVGFDESSFNLNPTKLSGGQKRKVALAGILAMNRPMLLLDEPCSGLDSKSSKEIMDVIANLNKNGITAIIATHDCELAIKYCKRIIVLYDGSIVLDGSPERIIESEDELKKYGIEIPEICKISHRLYKEGLLKDKNLYTAEELINALSIKEKL